MSQSKVAGKLLANQMAAACNILVKETLRLQVQNTKNIQNMDMKVMFP